MNIKKGSFDEINLHAKINSVILKLLKGKETATRLRTLLQDPVQDHGSVSFEELGLQILRSFTESISELSCCDESPESTQIVVGAGDGSTGSVVNSKRKNPGVKDRRGCYKRRKDGDYSRTITSQTTEDGRGWRKYGQKGILNSPYPRCYYRCTHKPDGCKATKQVQKIKEDPTVLFQITYFNHHTCTDSSLITTPQILVDSDPAERNLFSFKQSSTTPYSKLDKSPRPISSVNISQMKADTDQSENFSDAKSSLDPSWQNIVAQPDNNHWGGSYKPSWGPITTVGSSQYQEVVSGFNSCGSDLEHMEVDQLDDHDIDSFYLNDIYN